MSQEIEQESQRENVETQGSEPDKVDPSKDKKGFETPNQKPERKEIFSCYENTTGIDETIDPKQLIDSYQDLKPCLSLGNINSGPKKGKVLLETDFPVIDEKPPSEQNRLDRLQNKGNLKLLILQHKRYFFSIFRLNRK